MMLHSVFSCDGLVATRGQGGIWIDHPISDFSLPVARKDVALAKISASKDTGPSGTHTLLL